MADIKIKTREHTRKQENHQKGNLLFGLQIIEA